LSPYIKDASVEAILAAADIVDVVSGYTSLRKRGATHSGLCPFHQEKTPSFTVSADKGLFYCFGCGEGGDVVTFLRRADNLTFAEAVEQLGERYGVPVEYDAGTREEPSRERERRLLQLMEKASAFYQRFLWESAQGEPARHYLESRGLERGVCEEFRLGLSPAGWRGLYGKAVKEGYSDAELEAAGLLVRQRDRVYDRFRGRLMFPLEDHRGRIVGFGGRTLGDDTPKYLNSPEGPLYKKGELLYGLFRARRAIAETEQVLIVEGYTDVLALVQAGIGNVVASMGTALTQAQLTLLKRFTPNVTFMFDADRAGVSAVLRSGSLARQQNLRPMAVVLPKGLDPADAAAKQGAEAVKLLVARRMSLLGFEVRRVLDQFDIESSEGRVRALEELRGVLDQAALPKERDEEVAIIAERLRVSERMAAELLSEMGGGRAESARRRLASLREGRRSPRLADSPHALRVLNAEAHTEREFLAAAVCHPGEALGLLNELRPDHFSDSITRDAFFGLRSALAAEDPLQVLGELARSEGEAGRLFVRLAFECDQRRYTSSVLRELYYRLQDQHLGRMIAPLRGRLERAELTTEEERRLFKLEMLRQEIRATMLGTLEEV
jgi:DNA primase